jgi:hypothetical protein
VPQLKRVERIADNHETSPDSVHEPVAIEGWNVGSAAGADDHLLSVHIASWMKMPSVCRRPEPRIAAQFSGS